MAPTKERPATKTIATNREARHEYFVLEALETGVELKGTEVKSLRAGGVNLKDSWVDIEDGELLVKGMHISPYDHGNMFNQDPMRVRRLLAHKSEIRRLHQQCKLQGYTLVPLSLYFKHGRVKMVIFLSEIIADRDLTAIAHYGQKRSVADTHPTADCRAFCRCGRGQNVRLQVPADIEIDRPGGQGQQEQQAESGQRPEGAACKKQRRQRQQQDQITQGAA